jgi:hypothetical protein
MKDDLELFIEKLNSGKNVTFNDPRKQNFDTNLIDTKLRKVLSNINKSSWCWTLFSCQGHKHKKGVKSVPYIVFIVKNNYISKLLSILHNTLTYSHCKEFPLLGTSIEISSGFHDENFTVITVYWSVQFLANYDTLKQLHNRMEKMSEVILETDQ